MAAVMAQVLLLLGSFCRGWLMPSESCAALQLEWGLDFRGV